MSQPPPAPEPPRRDGRLAPRAGRFLTEKVLGIGSARRCAQLPEGLDARARHVIDPAETYLEEEPTVLGWFRDQVPSLRDVAARVQELFPSASWLRRYNVRWLAGDIVAGVTIGLVVVPQALAYASLARLDAAFGLYTSFTGAVLYWLFGTSKDIVIGTTAIGSLLVGQVVTRVQDSLPREQGQARFSAEQIAHTLSILAGAVLLFFGFLRLGWIIEFIPYIPISAFVTAASVTIMSTQAPTALGIRGVDTKQPPYRVIIATLQRLPKVRLDAAIGLSSIVLLFSLKAICSTMEARQPARRRLWTYLSSFRLTFTMLLYTLISFLVNRGLPADQAKFAIVGHIDRGFQKAGVPRLNVELMKLILPELPAVAVILVIEHIAIAKAMGRLLGYTINPSQEVVALGMANLFSPFVGGYVCTGSFGASAVLSKAGARTPLAGLFSALILVLALYALTGAFYYIPKAALAGLIIHAVCNLLTPPAKLVQYWRLSPVELLIWVAGVVLAIMVSLEASIYAGIAMSAALLLCRMARKRGTFLGVARVKRVAHDGDRGGDGGSDGQDGAVTSEAFLPVDRTGASNPEVRVESAYAGVLVYRLNEGFNYTNQAQHMDALLRHVVEKTKPMSDPVFEKESDRLWNDGGAKEKKCESEELPYLRAIVLDFAAVNHVDVTSVQGLVDLRNTLDGRSAPDAVEWHFANINNRWTRRALAAAGFGYPMWRNPAAASKWRPVFSIAETLTGKGASFGGGGGASETDGDEERGAGFKGPMSTVNVDPARDVEPQAAADGVEAAQVGTAAVYPVDRPFFHGDLRDAVEAATRDARSMDGHGPCP